MADVLLDNELRARTPYGEEVLSQLKTLPELGKDPFQREQTIFSGGFRVYTEFDPRLREVSFPVIADTSHDLSRSFGVLTGTPGMVGCVAASSSAFGVGGTASADWVNPAVSVSPASSRVVSVFAWSTPRIGAPECP